MLHFTSGGQKLRQSFLFDKCTRGSQTVSGYKNSQERVREFEKLQGKKLLS